MHENTGQPNKKSQPEGDFPKNTGKHNDDRQKARDEERDKRAADKNTEKVQA
ncbi:MAG: hypothetical protein CDV28_1613 [Candidatus Electronema aureum]|uniref:Uncharacterized protein n=1 Tax=Candidatus Electronema aureum TaxID=2005002 RepID=A0A521FYC6_9BACT|nr:MAG: hypothetical protein CDV28_1613 [Candidatus Electronema aureum]